MPQGFFRLKVEGKAIGRVSADIRQIAADAVDMGFAWPDLKGRIVLSELADIEQIAAVKCADRPCKFEPGICAASGKCQLTGSCNNH